MAIPNGIQANVSFMPRIIAYSSNPRSVMPYLYRFERIYLSPTPLKYNGLSSIFFTWFVLVADL
jgi:hypothetical protein